jgi:hypothetical protein
MRAIDRVLFGLLWVGLIGYALFLSSATDTSAEASVFDQARAMLTFDLNRADGIAIAIFNLLGVLPAAFMALILFDRGRPSPWPFALGAFALGGFVLLPYLLLRDQRPRRGAGSRAGVFVRAIGSRPAGAVMLAAAVILLGIGVFAGDPARFAEQAGASKLVAVMTADLLALTIALHLTAAADRRQRGILLERPAAAAVHVPLLGPLLYLALRPAGSGDHSALAGGARSTGSG